MKNTLDILHVTFDKSPTDETVMSVAKVVNGKIYVLKMELGEQADILYRLLTEKTAKMEIKAESKEQDTISRQAVLKGKVIHQSCDGIEIINGYAVPVEYIENLPPVTPQPKRQKGAVKNDK